MAPPDLPSGWTEVLDQLDEKHDRAHDRLRADLQGAISALANLTSTVDRNYRYFEDQNAALRMRISEVTQLAQRPVDGTSLVWGTKTVLAVIGAILVAGGMYWDLRQGNKDIRRDLDAARSETSKAIEEIKQQRVNDKREANDRLTQFLTQSLEKTMMAKGAKK